MSYIQIKTCIQTYFHFRDNFNQILNDLIPRYQSLNEVTTKMVNPVYKERPTCADLLSQSNFWLMTREELKKSVNYSTNLKKMREFENKFYFNYLVEKLIV